ncbi:MAG: hypothetical protein NVS3B10_02720 [Polyangiales bacterium]
MTVRLVHLALLASGLSLAAVTGCSLLIDFDESKIPTDLGDSAVGDTATDSAPGPDTRPDTTVDSGSPPDTQLADADTAIPPDTGAETAPPADTADAGDTTVPLDTADTALPPDTTADAADTTVDDTTPLADPTVLASIKQQYEGTE